MSQDNGGKKPKLNLELPEEVAPGVYSNLAVVTHSQTEFILDFMWPMGPMQAFAIALSSFDAATTWN